MDMEKFDGYDLIPVAKLDFGGGYDWDELEVYYIESERRFFWLSGQGCSCDYLWEDARKLGDLENGDRKAAVQAIRRYAKERNTSGRPNPWYDKLSAEVVMKVMTFRI